MDVKKDRLWQNQRVQQLYIMALTSRYGIIHHEVMVLLSALKRAGCKDAEWAITDIKKHSSFSI